MAWPKQITYILQVQFGVMQTSWSTAHSRNAAEAEIEAVRLKTLEFFQRQLDERNPQVFRAAIVDVRNYGLVVELPDALITGLVHVSSLTDDFYLFEPV